MNASSSSRYACKPAGIAKSMSLSPDRLFATPTPFALSLSKGCSFLRRRKQERCFDKPSTTGKRTYGFTSRPILPSPEIGRASCRERECTYGTHPVVAVPLKTQQKKKNN